jgi:hypothetical protein
MTPLSVRMAALPFCSLNVHSCYLRYIAYLTEYCYQQYRSLQLSRSVIGETTAVAVPQVHERILSLKCYELVMTSYSTTSAPMIQLIATAATISTLWKAAKSPLINHQFTQHSQC